MRSVTTGAKSRRRTRRGNHHDASPSRLGIAGREREDVEVARYIADMTAQLEAMALAAHFDLLAYFLAMARAESESSARDGAVAEARSKQDGPLMA